MANESGRLLVVDDDENNRDMLSRRLQRKGYKVATAVDGEHALGVIAEGEFDLILLDVMMPNLNGFETLKILRETMSATDLPVIMATAKDQSEDIVQALQAGANDYVTKPLDLAVVVARIETQMALKRAIDAVKRLERDLAERNKKLEQINARMEKDLKAAAKVQESTLPKKSPKTIQAEFAWVFRPCDELAGDGLSVFKLDERHIGIYLLDVSGHGVASALLSVTLSQVLSPLADSSSLVRQLVEGAAQPRIVPPVEVAEGLNRRFSFDSGTEQYFTIVYGILDLQDGLFRYVTAGHPGLAHIPAQGEPRLIEIPGYPIGWAEEPYVEHQVQLAPGDRLVAYSDGLPEAMNPNHEQFGGDRLIASLVSSSKLPLQESLEVLQNDVITFMAEATFRDDLSILGVIYKGNAS